MPILSSHAIPPGSLGSASQPTIEAAGLVLRPWRDEDAGLLVRAYADPEIRRWHVRSMDEAEALAWVSERHAEWKAEERGDWAVIHDDVPVGRVAAHSWNLRDGCGAAGYWVLPEARGRGIAAAALDVLCRWLFTEACFQRVELEHSVANPISCRVATKAGFTAEGTRRGAALHEDGWHDMHLHARLASDPAVSQSA